MVEDRVTGRVKVGQLPHQHPRQHHLSQQLEEENLGLRVHHHHGFQLMEEDNLGVLEEESQPLYPMDEVPQGLF